MIERKQRKVLPNWGLWFVSVCDSFASFAAVWPSNILETLWVMKILMPDFHCEVNEIGAFQLLHFMAPTLQHSSPDSCARPAGISHRCCHCTWCRKESCTLEGATVHVVEELDQTRQLSKSCKNNSPFVLPKHFFPWAFNVFSQAMQTSEMVLTLGEVGDGWKFAGFATVYGSSMMWGLLAIWINDTDRQCREHVQSDVSAHQQGKRWILTENLHVLERIWETCIKIGVSFLYCIHCATSWKPAPTPTMWRRSVSNQSQNDFWQEFGTWTVMFRTMVLWHWDYYVLSSLAIMNQWRDKMLRCLSPLLPALVAMLRKTTSWNWTFAKTGRALICCAWAVKSWSFVGKRTWWCFPVASRPRRGLKDQLGEGWKVEVNASKPQVSYEAKVWLWHYGWWGGMDSNANWSRWGMSVRRRHCT